jgi:3-oxoacyl-[acyl-carrier protein] reductase
MFLDNHSIKGLMYELKLAGSRNNGASDPVVLITGGTAGIGKEAVKLFYRNGFKVATFGSTSEKVHSLKQEMSDQSRILVHEVKMTDSEQLRNFVNLVETKLGPISVLINNAANLGPVGSIIEAEKKTIENTIAVNLMGPITLTTLVTKSMIKNRIAGVVVNVSSGCAKGLPGLSVYSATKAGLNSFSAAISQELASENISVYAFNPGHVDTQMQAQARNGDRIKSPTSNLLADVKARNELLKPEDSARHLFFLSTHPEKFPSGSTVVYSEVEKAMFEGLPWFGTATTFH